MAVPKHVKFFDMTRRRPQSSDKGGHLGKCLWSETAVRTQPLFVCAGKDEERMERRHNHCPRRRARHGLDVSRVPHAWAVFMWTSPLGRPRACATPVVNVAQLRARTIVAVRAGCFCARQVKKRAAPSGCRRVSSGPLTAGRAAALWERAALPPPRTDATKMGSAEAAQPAR